MIDFISLSLVKSLGLTPYIKANHHYIKLTLEGINKTISKTYGFYHLKLRITDRWNYSF